MKRFLLALIFLFLTVPAFAGVVGTIIDVSQDEQGAIVVKTNYVLDGVEVQSRYPTLNGQYYWVTRYNVDKFAGMTDAQVKTYILKDLQAFAQNLITKTFFQKANFSYTQAKANALIGTTGTVTTAEVLVDTNADNVPDTKWIVKSDGSYTSQAYTP